MEHPHLFLTRRKTDGLRTIDEVRDATTRGLSRALWERLRATADAELQADPLLPTSDIPHRGQENILHANRDFQICKATGDRLLTAALVGLLSGETAYRDAALRQIEALFDETRWPDWRDLAHFRNPADLRTGMLGKDIALAYDWLHPLLTEAQRAWIVDGLTRRAFDPFWESVAQGSFWVNGQNNWMTCIVGGLGVAAMAVGDAYPRAEELLAFSLPRLRGYLAHYGPRGEFNESVGYAGSTLYPVTYFMAYRYHTGGRDNIVGSPPFTDFCRWYLYFTLPPGKIVDFGDSHTDAPPMVSIFPAVAQAGRDGVLQWYYHQHCAQTPRSMPYLELLWLDESLAPVHPEGVLPRGHAFPAHSGNIVSRTDWNPRGTACVVYAKAGHGREGHGHHDAGQVCIDGYGERLIVDLGSPTPAYPPDFFGENRFRYYTAGVHGHNVLAFGGREMRRTPEDRAHILDARFDDHTGGEWSIDLTGMYDGVRAVRRTVKHVLPGIIAVLDEAELAQPEEISLRWHTIDRAAPDAEGRFTVRGAQASIAARLIALDSAALELSREEHAYHPPFDTGRLGDPLVQRHESYVEARLRADRCRLLTLFAVCAPGEEAGAWEVTEDGWSIETAQGRVTVAVTAAGIIVISGVVRDSIPR